MFAVPIARRFAMPPAFRLCNPIRIGKHTKVGQIRGVDTYIHWSVFLVVAIILAGVLRDPALTLLGLVAYGSVLLIHETGHLIAAQRLGCTVFSINLYPIFGVTRFGAPWSRLDHCIIAWAGVLAQAVVALPLVAWVAVFGYSRFEAVNMLFAILGFFSVAVALFNLLPIPGLDGATAWGIFPALWTQRRLKKPPRKRPY
jgi:membrane-associated protease RseP (regulator of RpoE activity)